MGPIFQESGACILMAEGHFAWSGKYGQEVMNAATAVESKQIANKELSTQGTDWSLYKHEIMYDLLIVKLKQCHVFRDCLRYSGNDMLIEDTNHEYWARGRSGNGLNMLGKLPIEIRNLFQQDRNKRIIDTLQMV